LLINSNLLERKSFCNVKGYFVFLEACSKKRRSFWFMFKPLIARLVENRFQSIFIICKWFVSLSQTDIKYNCKCYKVDNNCETRKKTILFLSFNMQCTWNWKFLIETVSISGEEQVHYHAPPCWGQFHQRLTSSFYARRSQKRTKDSQVVNLFWVFNIWGSLCGSKSFE